MRAPVLEIGMATAADGKVLATWVAGAETSGQDVVFMLTVAEGYSTNDLGYLSRDALKLPTRTHTS